MRLDRVRPVCVGRFQIGDGQPLCLIAGPCVIESEGLVMDIAGEVSDVCRLLGINYIYKASFDKANRTSRRSFRGIGMNRGLEILKKVRRKMGVPVLTDIHEPGQAGKIAAAVDVLQIPAFLCRQTDLILAAARTGRPLNIKKGQFVSPWEMAPVVEKARSGGARNVLLTERGTQFGYQRLISDMRSLPIMRGLGCPVIFDAGHSVQEPGSLGRSSGGDRRFIPILARAAAAVGIDGLFVEVHPKPERARSDGPTSLRLKDLRPLLESVMSIREALSAF